MSAPQQRALSVQVYSLWSTESAGVGDLADVATLATGVRDRYDLLLLSPLHASLPGTPQEPSPYYPSSRQFRNPLYLRVPGVGNGVRERIDRSRAWTEKMEVLLERFGGAEVLVDDPELHLYATFCVLTEWFGRPWTAWPRPYRQPFTPEVRSFTASHAARVRFHEWLQVEVDRQLAALAAVGPGLVTDLAVGFDPLGYDAWRWQDALASGYTVGAPPDDFNAGGQNWGVPPFDPVRLAEVDYAPIRAALRSAFHRAAGVRIDHVTGLFRLFWIPEGGSAADGEYVHYPYEDLLDIVLQERERAGGFVVGEDLGTVEPWMRDELRARGVLSYKVLWFEDDPPEKWPEQSVAAVTTHDLPTIAGVASGVDGTDAMRAKLPASLDGAPSRVIIDTLEDLLCVPHRPNYPGTDNPWNWCRPLPLSVDQIVAALSVP